MRRGSESDTESDEVQGVSLKEAQPHPVLHKKAGRRIVDWAGHAEKPERSLPVVPDTSLYHIQSHLRCASFLHC